MADDQDDRYPSERMERFIVRMPDGMRDRIKAEAEQHNRSMNAEIIARLDDYPKLLKALGEALRDKARLTDDKERLELEFDQLAEVQQRFFEKDGKQKPVLAIPQGLLDRINLSAEQNHRTLDAEAIAALEVAFPPKSIDINLLSAFLISLIGVSAPDGDREYLDYINDALAAAKQPWTVRAGWDGEISFYPFATPSKDDDVKDPSAVDKGNEGPST
nr:Arc family DNA-binding protein [Aminobacter aminovorans]